MTLQRITTLSLFATLSLSACDLGEKSIGNDTGADNGDGDGDGDGDGNDGEPQPYNGECGEQTITLMPDPDAPLPEFDSTLSEYLGIVEGGYLGSFAWGPNDGFLVNEHADSESELTVTASYQGGEVRLIEVEDVGQYQGGNIEIGLCSNALEIDLVLEFATADGLFAETFDVTATVLSHGFDLGDGEPMPTFGFTLDMDALEGTLSLDDFSTSEGEITDLTLSGRFDPTGIDGELALEIVTMEWVGVGIIASFDAARQP